MERLRHRRGQIHGAGPLTGRSDENALESSYNGQHLGIITEDWSKYLETAFLPERTPKHKRLIFGLPKVLSEDIFFRLRLNAMQEQNYQYRTRTGIKCMP
ncbi:hypothetical protein Zmor_010607 [Zophobas morio]|uniref:Uncharacterized protein n=1 Tax=Zophobas morio TaxID=2755281 RepID=A0AA38IKM9_9CUCU|nr:hypothetical protein Zmor_010607 [Zophobas morio]